MEITAPVFKQVVISMIFYCNPVLPGFRACMNGITTFGMLIILVSMAACTDSLEPRVSSDASPEKGAAQSVTETEAIATGAQRSGDSIIFKGICDGSAAVT